jgi:peptidoglycan/LPS O-acetylase OafA/YrhL
MLFSAIALSSLAYLFGLSFIFGVLFAVASALLIVKACEGFKGWIGWLLNQQVLIYLGKISYGLYVYHNFMPWLLRCIRGTETRYPINIPHLPMTWLQQPVAILAIQFIMLITIASLSWYLIEKPLNQLKRYYK